MDDICGLKFYLLYVHTSQKNINAQYMRNPDMVYVLKMEYVSKINIFGLNMMVKSGLEKIFFVKYVHIINKTLSHKFHPYSILST